MPALTANSKTTWSLVDLSEDSNLEGVVVQVPFVIGRRESSDLTLACITVSGKHAEFVFKDDELWINDLGSTNGTFVNGARVSKSTQLKNDDIVQFGSMVFKVDRQGDVLPGKRVEEQTLASDIPESAEGRFARLLRVGVVPFFQSVFDLTSVEPRLVGYEVLGRGRLPGLCTPEEMFTAAMEMEKTAELSEALRKRGIEVADANFSSGKMIFVNTHPSEISSDRLGESLSKIRAIHPDRNFSIELPAAVLEMPESMSVIEAATEGMNIDLSIYGFQAESIRLVDLQRLAPRVVKFSDSLVRDIENAGRSKQQLVSSMVKMLTELGIKSMAERVETSREHESLKGLGFQLAQGFYYGRPSSIEDCVAHQEGSGQVARSEPIGSVNQSLEKSSQLNSLGGTGGSEVGAAKESKESKIESGSDVSWLLSQPAEKYTLQLMVTTSKDVALEFIGKQDQPDEFVIVAGMGTRGHLFSVFHGSFSNRGTAKEVSAKFKNSSYCPLVRRFSNVHARIDMANLKVD